MKVHEFIEWLKQYPDQNAEVEVVLHKDARDYYLQGGTASVAAFDPDKGTFESYTGSLLLGVHNS